MFMFKLVVFEVKGWFILVFEVMNRFGKVGKKIVSVKKQGFFFELMVFEVCVNGLKEYQIYQNVYVSG